MLVALGDSITADPWSWATRMSVPVANLAADGAMIGDVIEQIRRAPAADAAVLSVGTNHIVKPGGSLDFEALDDVAALLRRFPRIAVLPALCRVGTGGAYDAEFTERRRVFLEALVRADLAPLPFELRRWEWRPDHTHPNRFGQRHLAQQVRRWLRRTGA